MTYRYWKIKIVPINPKKYGGSSHERVFKGKVKENAVKSAERHCKEDIKTFGFQIYAIQEVLYECDHNGRKKA